MTELRGISWDHERGYGPLQATAETYMQQHPDVHIHWEVRTLQEFADYPVNELAEDYDLLIIDHPFVGFAADDGCLVPLDEHVEPAFLDAQAAQSVGQSHPSYSYAGHQWALAIDAAAQVSSYRPDLLARLGHAIPQTWHDVISLARTLHEDGEQWVAIPLIPIDAMMSFLTLCANAGEPPYTDDNVVVSRSMGRSALQTLTALVRYCHPESLDWNPIRTYERMSTSDEVVYCPLAFGYSNYAQAGFREHLVRFTNIPRGADNRSSGGILGGTGFAVSSYSENVEAAVAYGAYVADADIQRTVYFEGGGQPGNRVAWTDPDVNAASNNYFADTLETLDRAYLRPRCNGFIHVQDKGGPIIHDFLRNGGDPDAVLDALDELYRTSCTGSAA